MRTSEPEIIINGHKLTPAEAMALRVQVASGLYYYADPDALGDDFHGQTMTKLYRASLENIQKLMLD